MTSQLKGLKEFVLSVEQFIHGKFPPQQGGASAPSDSLRLGYTDHAASTRPTHATSSTAASSSAARAPNLTPIQDYGPSERLPSATPTGTTVFSTSQSNVRLEM